MTAAVLQTQRLRLEPLGLQHLGGLRAMDSDPEVMRYLSGGVPRDEAATRAMITRVQKRWDDTGFSWWAAVTRRTRQTIGAACVQHVAEDPKAEIEIGWRLARAHWGQGYAHEMGQAAIQFAFRQLGLGHVIAVADPDNAASIAVMKRLGMCYRGIETHYDEDCVTYEARA